MHDAGSREVDGGALEGDELPVDAAVALQDAEHARGELARVDRLGDHVVGPELEPDDALEEIGARAQDAESGRSCAAAARRRARARPAC